MEISSMKAAAMAGLKQGDCCEVHATELLAVLAVVEAATAMMEPDRPFSMHEGDVDELRAALDALEKLP